MTDAHTNPHDSHSHDPHGDHSDEHGKGKPAAERSIEERLRENATFIPAVMGGLARTVGHIIRNRPNTISYPEERREPLPGYRGEHRLNRDELGREKCTACMLCATACPAHCIEIVGEPAPWDDREKRPRVFNIDMLRCIYCGLCEWACPCDAIELTSVFNVVSRTREEKIYTKERLLSN